jgi:hypothetical protein
MEGRGDERPSLETSKVCLYFSGIVVFLSHQSWLFMIVATYTGADRLRFWESVFHNYATASVQSSNAINDYV